LAGDVACARRLLRTWPVRQVVVTRGQAGAVLVQDADSPALVVPAEPTADVDACGAGDSFAVAAALSLGTGKTPAEAVVSAVRAAARYVARGGPTGLPDTIHPGAARKGSGRVDPGADHAMTLARQVRECGDLVVATGGCFDLLHVGHVALLDNARRLGGCLVVCLNSDASVARLKGPGRPLIPQQERAAMLLALTSVDAVMIFDDDTPHQALAMLRPDIYVKGGDYGLGTLPERSLVESWGAQVVLLPYLPGRSTTSLIDAAVQTTA